jgi:predicted hotdog family 3-hydroxylacyl-ACP dehydratase
VSERIVVPDGGPLFEGHFPGRPILPGVTELILVAGALDGGDVSEVLHARFRELVGPGDLLDLGSTPAEGGATRFELRRAGVLVANGSLRFGPPTPNDRPAMSQAARTPRGVPPPAELLPHRPPMLFIHRVLGEADDGVTCLARIPEACGLVSGGRASALVALEVAAQTAAAWEALRRRRETDSGAPKVGYLVSARDVVFHRATLPPEADLIASIRLEALAPPLATYAVELAFEGELAMRGTIGTYLSG